MSIKTNQNLLNCFRCDGKGKFRNEFGLMEKCESCQKKEMTFDSIDNEPDEDQLLNSNTLKFIIFVENSWRLHGMKEKPWLQVWDCWS